MGKNFCRSVRLLPAGRRVGRATYGETAGPRGPRELDGRADVRGAGARGGRRTAGQRQVDRVHGRGDRHHKGRQRRAAQLQPQGVQHLHTREHCRRHAAAASRHDGSRS